MVVSLLVAFAKLPGGLDRFLPCRLGSHVSRLRRLGWNQCSHGLTSRPLESCHHQCVKAVCGVLGYPKGSASELLDGTLKLRHCTDLFTMRFPPPPSSSPPPLPPGLYPGLVKVVGRDGLLLLVFLRLVIIWVKGSGLPERHVQVFLFTVIQTRGIQRRGDGKDCASLPPKEWGVSWVSFAPGDAWNLPPEGTGVGLLLDGQTSRRDCCAGTSPFT